MAASSRRCLGRILASRRWREASDHCAHCFCRVKSIDFGPYAETEGCKALSTQVLASVFTGR